MQVNLSVFCFHWLNHVESVSAQVYMFNCLEAAQLMFTKQRGVNTSWKLGSGFALTILYLLTAEIENCVLPTCHRMS